MSGKPYFNLFPADWIRDTEDLTPLAEWAWFRLTLALDGAPERGDITWTFSRMANYLSRCAGNWRNLITELQSAGVADIVFDEEKKTVHLMSRRMLREKIERKQWAEEKARQRERKVQEMSGQSPPVPTPTPTPKKVSSDKNPQIHYPSGDFLDPELNSKNGRKAGNKMPSMNLSPELKTQTDRLYQLDPEKYKKAGINKWINQGRKNGWRETDLAEVLRRFWDHSYHFEDDWWPILETICESVRQDESRKVEREREAKWELEKREEARGAAKLLRH